MGVNRETKGKYQYAIINSENLEVTLFKSDKLLMREDTPKFKEMVVKLIDAIWNDGIENLEEKIE
jgi:hypothetical protein